MVRVVAVAGARSFAWAGAGEGRLAGGDGFLRDAASAVRAAAGTESRGALTVRAAAGAKPKGDGVESPISVPEPRAHADPATASTTSAGASER